MTAVDRRLGFELNFKILILRPGPPNSSEPRRQPLAWQLTRSVTVTDGAEVRSGQVYYSAEV